MVGINLQQLVNLQKELNRAVTHYMQLATDEQTRKVLAEVLTRGKQNLNDLGGSPSNVRRG